MDSTNKMRYKYSMMNNLKQTTGLMLTGGGARAAYQAGVLVALSEGLGHPVKSPFEIYSGTSAGAINAAFSVQGAENWGNSVQKLCALWGGLRASDIYETEWSKIWKSAKPWVKMLGAPIWGGSPQPPKSLLDNSPLNVFLSQYLKEEKIHENISNGNVSGLALTAFDYTTGLHTTFFDTSTNVEPWSRHQRTSQRTQLTKEHVMASSALPLIFPSIGISGREYGDGAMRQTAPLSPLIKMGASRLVVVGASYLPDGDHEPSKTIAITPATILGHAMSSIFLDQLGADVERVERLNELAAKVKDSGCDVGIREVDLHVIRPSRRLDIMAAQSVHALPKSIQKVLGVLGVKKGAGGALASYLLFEPEFIKPLMELGYEDTKRQMPKLIDFTCGEQLSNKSCKVKGIA
jgi:NTE family protein